VPSGRGLKGMPGWPNTRGSFAGRFKWPSQVTLPALMAVIGRRCRLAGGLRNQTPNDHIAVLGVISANFIDLIDFKISEIIVTRTRRNERSSGRRRSQWSRCSPRPATLRV
jgi:hypothetical protein